MLDYNLKVQLVVRFHADGKDKDHNGKQRETIFTYVCHATAGNKTNNRQSRNSISQRIFDVVGLPMHDYYRRYKVQFLKSVV